jgi:RHS repeat-associated protein
MTYDGATTYTWDARNRLGAFGSTTFAYDSFGPRTRNATGIAFLYDGANAVQELSGSTVTANLLTGGVDEIFTRTDSAGTRNFLADALGSALALTDSTGAVQTQYSYEPFGKTTATGSASSSTFQYTGRENDGTGMYYYRARYYHPTLGRFISEDPAGFGGGGASFYVYAGDAPAEYDDPSGLKPKDPGPPGPRGPPGPPWPLGLPTPDVPDGPTRPWGPQSLDPCQAWRDRRERWLERAEFVNHHMHYIAGAGATAGGVLGALAGAPAEFGGGSFVGAYFGAHVGVLVAVEYAHDLALTMEIIGNWPPPEFCVVP